jgi:O-antigen ligase
MIRRLETIFVVFLLLVSEANLPSTAAAIVKVASYGVVGFLLLRQPPGRLAYVATRDWSLLLLTTFAITSLFWSENPVETADQLKALIRATLLGIYLATRYPLRQQLQLLAWALGISAIMSMVVSIALPAYGTSVANHLFVWQGIYGHKQYLARAMTVAAIVFLLLIVENRNYRWLKVALLVIALALIWMSTSRTGIGFFILSIFLIPLHKIIRQPFKVREIILLLALVIFGGIIILIIGNLETIVVDIMGKNLEFNGRAPLWERCIKLGLERPWLGYGYAGFWNSPISLEVGRGGFWIGGELGTAHSHSGFIDTFLTLGLVGLSLAVLNFLSTLLRILKLLFRTREVEVLWGLQMVVLMFCFNIFELNTILISSFFWIFYISISLSTVIEYGKIQKRKIPSVSTNYKTLVSDSEHS